MWKSPETPEITGETPPQEEGADCGQIVEKKAGVKSSGKPPVECEENGDSLWKRKKAARWKINPLNKKWKTKKEITGENVEKLSRLGKKRWNVVERGK